MNKCPTCKKTFVDISETWREILGCPKCGLHKADAEKVVANQRKRSPVLAPAPEPKPTTDWDRDCEWMRKLTLKIASEHGYDNFRVTWGSAGSWCKPKSQRIHYGAESIQRDRETGFTEYVTWGHELWSHLAATKTVKMQTGWTRRGRPSYSRWVKTDLVGRQGLWAMVLHEFAHTEGHYHDNAWADKVRELQVLYPYEECVVI